MAHESRLVLYYSVYKGLPQYKRFFINSTRTSYRKAFSAKDKGLNITVDGSALNKYSPTFYQKRLSSADVDVRIL